MNTMRRATTKPKRERMIGVKVTDEEYEAIRVLAFKAHKSLGAYVRERVLPSSTADRAK